jgi:Coenzyme PQQ synthesis protein D (PqqD)
MAEYLVHSKGLASRRVGDEEVIVSPRAGKVWSLNSAGALLWELADGSQETAELVDVLARARGLDAAAAAAELQAFAAEMAENGLVQWHEARSARSARSERAAQTAAAGLSEAPGLLHQEQLQVLAGACDSNHSGQGAACMLVGSCASVFN